MSRPASERFWEKVYERGNDECWLWRGYVMSNGYGQFSIGLRPGTRTTHTLLAHRFAYEDQVGPIPDGMQLDHLCRVRACVNPAHLEVVTPRENMRRENRANGRGVARTHCPQGHEYDETNTRTDPNTGRRACRACHLARELAAYAAGKRYQRKPGPRLHLERNAHRIAQWHGEGVSNAEIARRLGVSGSAIDKRVKKLRAAT